MSTAGRGPARQRAAVHPSLGIAVEANFAKTAAMQIQAPVGAARQQLPVLPKTDHGQNRRGLGPFLMPVNSGDVPALAVAAEHGNGGNCDPAQH